ncbi:hypothetical protein BKA82DRAFT_4022147 [Pisolithus tinctorius]|nr:hypothetical protein BKA82DRAFT_4022415 [Pisolithus tinctorius]KAI6137989.1 hypothetical protein BKA82DRAFT_4022147 [Pisolithus tinctorius]
MPFTAPNSIHQSTHWCQEDILWSSIMGNMNSKVTEGKQACVTENSKGAWTTPSVVAFTKHGEHLIGLPAKCQAVGLIGCKFKGVDVQEDLKHWLSAEELSSMVLTKMHETAEQFLDKKVKQIMIDTCQCDLALSHTTHDLYHINIDPWNTWLITYQKEPSPLGVSEFVRGGSDHGWDNHWQEQQDEDEGEPQL